MPRISVTVITRDEEANIGEALASVAWADEIVVVDALSTDRTVEIARGFSARVHQERLPYGSARNKAAELATGDWIFSLDADERCPPEAREEIARIAADPASADAWFVPRRNFFLGREIRHGGWYPDYRQPQLYRKGAVTYGAEPVHESFRVTGRVGHMRAAIIQVPYRDIEQMQEKGARYSTQGAEKLIAAGGRGGVAAGIIHGAAFFFKSYFLKGMFLDGWQGFLLSLGGTEYTFWKYAKVRGARAAGNPGHRRDERT